MNFWRKIAAWRKRLLQKAGRAIACPPPVRKPTMAHTE
jgi:hypothetical protein